MAYFDDLKQTQTKTIEEMIADRKAERPYHVTVLSDDKRVSSQWCMDELIHAPSEEPVWDVLCIWDGRMIDHFFFRDEMTAIEFKLRFG